MTNKQTTLQKEQNEPLAAVIEMLTERVNRIEAEVAHQRVVAVDPAVSATATSITILERAIEVSQKSTEEYRRILADMRKPHRGR